MSLTIMSIVIIAVLIVLNIIVLLKKNRIDMEKTQLAKENEGLLDEKTKLTQDIGNLSAEKSALDAEKKAIELENVRLKAEAKARDEQAEAAKVLNEKSLEALREQFRNLSSENSEAFRKRSESAINDLLKPVQEKFDALGAAVKESREKSIAQHARLDESIRNLMDQSKAVGDEARNLANALTQDSKAQGDFGEMILTSLLESVGLREGEQFFTQRAVQDDNGAVIKSDDNKVMIPDVMVRYPGNEVVIIDSKMSLTAYNSYVSARTEEEKHAFLKAHLDSVRKHVDELACKDYNSYLGDHRKIDYNLMFIPVEGAFSLMLQAEPSIWSEAQKRNVIIVSQTNLIVVLNMIKISWNQFRQEQNLSNVYKVTEDFMGKLKVWLQKFEALGKAVSSVGAAYEEVRTSLSGKSNLVTKGENVMKALRKEGLAQIGNGDSDATSGKDSIVTSDSDSDATSGKDGMVSREPNDAIYESTERQGLIEDIEEMERLGYEARTSRNTRSTRSRTAPTKSVIPPSLKE